MRSLPPPSPTTPSFPPPPTLPPPLYLLFHPLPHPRRHVQHNEIPNFDTRALHSKTKTHQEDQQALRPSTEHRGHHLDIRRRSTLNRPEKRPG
ncbi:hypothetical protein BDZ91DRAFT_734361 [Kalaharituber pfeilii]|nr:hypothetical protein BDZ91DRAFT_734361 [Kalaharituber pfeilii]